MLGEMEGNHHFPGGCQAGVPHLTPLGPASRVLDIYVVGCRTRDILVLKKEAQQASFTGSGTTSLEGPRMQLGAAHGVSFATVLWYFQMTGKGELVQVDRKETSQALGS